MIFKNYINSSYVDFLSHNNNILLSTSLFLHLHLSIIARHYCAASLKCVVHPQILVMSYVSSRVFAHVYAFICFIRKIHKHMDARRYSYSMKAKHGKQLIMTINTQRQLGWRQQLKVAPHSSCLSDLNGGGSK